MGISRFGFIAILFPLFAFTSDKPAYVIFNIEGEKSTYGQMIADLEKADIVFIGELHNNSIAHWLEYEITSDLFELRGGELILGAEMFERDNQLVIEEYMTGFYKADKFEAEAKLWENYTTDYKPLLEFARENSLPFLATNIPRRYASMVDKGGFEVLDPLSQEAKSYIAPLPIVYDPEVKCYKDMMESQDMGPHVTENFPKAQAVKDATMAHSILENWNRGKLFIHFNGAYHSRNFEGIIWYINQMRPGLKIVTVETIVQKEIDGLDEENIGIASYVVGVPESMTNTY